MERDERKRKTRKSTRNASNERIRSGKWWRHKVCFLFKFYKKLFNQKIFQKVFISSMRNIAWQENFPDDPRR